MKRLARFLAPVGMAGLILAIFWMYGLHPTAQTTITSTTLSAAVAKADTAISLTSDTGVAAGTYLYVDHELMQALSEVGTSSRWNVRRGLADGGTPAVQHANAAVVYVMSSGGAGESYFTYDVVSGQACTTSDLVYQPRINVRSGQIADCEQSAWMVRRADLVYVRDYTVRDSFDQGYNIMQDDGTAKSLSDAETNYVDGSPLGAIAYREELAKTASSWIVDDGKLDPSADDGATDAEGVEVIFGTGTGTDQGVIVAGTQGACFEASITDADVNGSDFVVIGWHQNEALVDNATPASYTLYNLVGIYNSEDGSIFHIESGATSDDSGVNWADGETRALKVCISKAGVPSAYYSAAYTESQTRPVFPTYTVIPNVNNGTTLTAGTQMVPFFTLLHGNDAADSNIRVNWFQLTRLP